MPLTTFAGHPLHPQLVELPLGMLPFSLAMDATYILTGDESYANAAYYSMIGGSLTAVVAGAAGAADYFTIPSGTQSARTANVHAALNLGLIGLYGFNLFLRRGRTPPTGPLPVLLSALGGLGLIVSSWYGGRLVYELGMRVKPLMEGPPEPEWKVPGGEQVEKALRGLEQAVGSTDGGSR